MSPSQSQIYVNLGALDIYEPATAVDIVLTYRLILKTHNAKQISMLKFRLSTGIKLGTLFNCLLILEDKVKKPRPFVTSNVKNFMLSSNIYHSKSSAQKGNPLIDGGVALLDSPR